MHKTLLRRGIEALVTLLCATLVIFLLTRLSPGDPVRLYMSASADVAMSDTTAFEAKAAELRAEWGLDRGFAAQYADWIERMLRLDLGASLHTGRPVADEIAERLPATLALSAAALLLQLLLGVSAGTYSALRAGKPSDGIIRLACVVLASAPGYVIGLLLLSLFAVTLDAYEISSTASLDRLWLPAAVLGLVGAPPFIRVVRASVLTEFGQLYVLSSMARGLPRIKVMLHALRNALLPVVTMTGLSLTSLIGGSVVIESIFAWPGIGQYALDSILRKDYPVIQGYACVTVALVVVVHYMIDILYLYADPRLRGTKGAKANADAA